MRGSPSAATPRYAAGGIELFCVAINGGYELHHLTGQLVAFREAIQQFLVDDRPAQQFARSSGHLRSTGTDVTRNGDEGMNLVVKLRNRLLFPNELVYLKIQRPRPDTLLGGDGRGGRALTDS